MSKKLRLLSRKKQEEVLDFLQFLLYKAQPTKQFSLSSESRTSPTQTPPLKRSLLEGEDYLIDPAITRSHDAFLKGYAPEDEGLYDDYRTWRFLGGKYSFYKRRRLYKTPPTFAVVGWRGCGSSRRHLCQTPPPN